MSTVRFIDRADAGRRLAAKVPRYARGADVLVLALPRGGVAVGYELARALHAALDVIVVRPVRAPGHPDVALGAVASGGMRVLHPEAIERAGLTPQAIDAACAVEWAEVARRERECRGCAAAQVVRRRTVIVVDDGLGVPSIPLALAVLRTQRPARLVAAVPLVVRSSSASIWERADEVASIALVDRAEEVTACYERDAELRDEDVRDLLLRASRELTVKGATPNGSPR